MKTWIRKTALSETRQLQHKEIWEYVEGHRTLASFEIDVTIGKPLDVLSLKGTSLQRIRDYAEFLRRTANVLYGSSSGRQEFSACPCCGADSARAVDVLSIFDIAYKRCWQCAHVFIFSQPSPEALLEVFAKSEGHPSVYIDEETLAIRLDQVVKPKLDWTLQVYRQHRGREGISILDVGGGGGHFIEVCKRSGVRAEGYELSEACRRFAKKTFGIHLHNDNFLTQDGRLGKFEILTFWGLLEYTPEPRKYLNAAYQHLNFQTGMLVVEVPRFDCVGTAVQKERSATVARHLDPTSHVNCFSDASLVTALFTSGFKPIAAWYYGMDAYELLVQLALQLDDPEMMGRLSHWIPGLQASFDSAQLCDNLIIAAVPLAENRRNTSKDATP